MFTRFMDMHSGGGCKLKPYEYIYIEGDENGAIAVFMQRFNRDPHNVTCDCCGQDYSVDTEESLELVSAYERNCDWDKVKGEYDLSTGISVEEYSRRKDVLIIQSLG